MGAASLVAQSRRDVRSEVAVIWHEKELPQPGCRKTPLRHVYGSGMS